MKPGNILSTVILVTILIGMIFTNFMLKKEYLKIDLNDEFKNYISQDIEEYSVLHIKGSNGYPIEIIKGKEDDLRVRRSRLSHFHHNFIGDTLSIEFTGTNIPIEHSFSNKTSPGIIIEKDEISKIIVSNTYNRISGFSGQEMDIELKNSSIVEISDLSLEILNLYSEKNSQYIFKENNLVSTINLTMLHKSIGWLNEIDFLNLNTTLGDSISLVLSKNPFIKIKG